MKESEERVIAHGALLDLRKSLKETDRVLTGKNGAGEYTRMYESLTASEKDLLQCALEFTKPRQPTWRDKLKEKLTW